MAAGEGVLVAQGGGSWVLEHHQSTRSARTGSGEAMRGGGGGSTASLSSPAPMAAVDGEVGVWAREGARGSFYRRHGFETKQTHTQGRSIWGQVGRRQSTAGSDAVWRRVELRGGKGTRHGERRPGRRGFGSTRGRAGGLIGGAARGRPGGGAGVRRDAVGREQGERR